MVYLSTIPKDTDDPATQSQAQLLENFAQLDSQFGTDHIALTNGVGADEGEHKIVNFNDVQADPVLTFPKASIYTKHIGAGTGDDYTNLYFRADPEKAATTDSPFVLNSIKAWCHFDGTLASPIAITDGFNVTNVTKNGTGNYTVNFTNALQNTTFAVFVTTRAANLADGLLVGSLESQTINNCLIFTTRTNPTQTGRWDSAIINVIVIGN